MMVCGMDRLESAKKKLKTALDEQERACGDIIRKQDEVESKLLERLKLLDEKKLRCTAENGNLDASDNDLIEINAGGKIIAAKRRTLTQLKGTKNYMSGRETRLEGLFNGRWDKKLLRDDSGRIFLDVNGNCFLAIVDWLNELTISSEDKRPDTPTISDEFKPILAQYMQLFGMRNASATPDKLFVYVVERAADQFTKEINEAINEKWKSLQFLKDEVEKLEKSYQDEEQFINFLSSGENKDIITLNVSGTVMMTKRDTLMFVKDSVLAQQFDDTKWTVQGSNNLRGVKEWSPEDVTKWVKDVEGLKKSVSNIFKENEINGLELLALNEVGLEKMGVTRPGTICLLMKAIKQLEKSTQGVSTLIEYSPYCFGKLLDCLRLKHVHFNDFIDQLSSPTISSDQKERYKKVVEYYFPGDSPKFLLPEVENVYKRKRKLKQRQ
mmetsp:Transcript_20594/g.32238  ORF Transcript_20594/g.32238 Transcript_20594/m.32238 type:complete len:439 (+) Transcript_20594:2-1318(+)